MSSYSCAKRAADPTNEFAACRQHCGNDAECLRVAPDVAIAGICFHTANTLARMVWKLNDVEHGEAIAEVLRNARDQLEQMGSGIACWSTRKLRKWSTKATPAQRPANG